MKKILFAIVILFIFTCNVYAFDFARFLFESAIETDRHQSYQWYFATKDNPIISPYGYKLWETNPFVAGKTKDEFDIYNDVWKEIHLGLKYIIEDEEVATVYRTIMAIGQCYIAYANNEFSKRYGYPEIWTISYSWEF